MNRIFSGACRIAAILLIVCLIPMSAFADGVLRAGDTGDAVLSAQIRLKELGYYDDVPNGVFDERMTNAVLYFQSCNDLLESGILDGITQRVLFSEDAVDAYELYFVTEELFDSCALSTGTKAASKALYNSSPVLMASPVNMNTNEYSYFSENGFHSVRTSPLSTFAADADTASYAQLRAKILSGEDVPASSVRIEEMLNYFDYKYDGPKDNEPFGVTMEVTECPWNPQTRLLLIGLQAKEISTDNLPAKNLVFLLDVSGSMDEDNKLPLVKRAFSLLLETLSPEDTVSIVTYASRDEIVLDGVPAGEKARILEAIERLEAGGATAGAAGIQTAYALAEKHFIQGGCNRILLATDGDLNVGCSDQGALVRLIEEKKQGGVFLSVLGFGDGNYKDNKLEALADFGNGNYHYIDTIFEARRALVTEAGANFYTVAKDVKLQLDFNPENVKDYRLIGYENRLLADEDFNDDSKDGGEIGSGHRMTVLYELVPADSDFEFGETESKYTSQLSNDSAEWLTLSLRAKEPDGEESALYTYPLIPDKDASAMSDNLRFAAAVAEFGMLLRDNEWKGNSSWDSVLELLRGCASVSGDPLKEEFLYMATLMQRAA